MKRVFLKIAIIYEHVRILPPKYLKNINTFQNLIRVYEIRFDHGPSLTVNMNLIVVVVIIKYAREHERVSVVRLMVISLANRTC